MVRVPTVPISNKASTAGVSVGKIIQTSVMRSSMGGNAKAMKRWREIAEQQNSRIADLVCENEKLQEQRDKARRHTALLVDEIVQLDEEIERLTAQLDHAWFKRQAE